MTHATLKDVAKEADVSVSTASLVLNKKGQFSQDVRDRVYEAAQKIGYSKTVSASAGTRKHLDHIAILVFEDVEKGFVWNFFRRIIVPLESAIAREQFSPAIIPVSLHHETSEVLEKIAASKVKAVFSLEYGNPELFRQLEEQGIPVVVINNSNYQQQFHSVCIDELHGAYDAAKYLIGLGHIQIAYFDYHRPDMQTALNDRFVGFKLALDDAKLTFSEEHRVVIDLFNVRELQRALKKLFRRMPTPTAIFAHDDYFAARIISALQNIQLRVPEDVSIVALGDILDYTQPFIPPITTMRINNELMGKLAGEMLLERLNNPHEGLPIHVLKINQQLVERGSCRQVPYKKKFLGNGIDKESAEQPKDIQIGLTSYSLHLTYWAMLTQSARERAVELGIKLSLLPCNKASEQAIALRRFISQGVDAIIVGAIERNNPELALASKEALEAGIPVIFAGLEPESATTPATCSIRCDNFKGGELAAAYILQQLNGKGDVALIDAPWPLPRIQGFRKVIDEEPNCHITFEARCDWTRESGALAMREALRVSPNVRAVYAASDPLALGALDVIQEASPAQAMTVVGYDGLPEGCVAIYQGKMGATVDQSPFTVGAQSIDTALRILRGESVVPSLLVEPKLITTENVVETSVNMLGLLPPILQGVEEINAEQQRLRGENIRMSADLELSRRLQHMFLASGNDLQQLERLEVAGFTEPAHSTGGHYYHLLKESDGVHIGIGDITGHGLEGGVLMLMTQTAIRTLIDRGETDPVAFLTTLNRVICSNTKHVNMNNPLTLAFVTYHHGQLKIIGQHEAMLIVRQNGRLEHVGTIDLGTPLDRENDIVTCIEQATALLQTGDGVLFYADGILEAEDPSGNSYGITRLFELVKDSWSLPAEEIKQTVIADVNRHLGDQHGHDDLALIVLKQK